MTNGTDGPVPGGNVAIAEAKLVVLEVLADVLEWQLPGPRWERVTEIVQSIDDAVLSGDLAALEAAIVNLVLLSPVRVTRIGSTQDKVKAPAQIRERVNRLQHTLAESLTRRDADGRRDGGHDQPRDQR